MDGSPRRGRDISPEHRAEPSGSPCQRAGRRYSDRRL